MRFAAVGLVLTASLVPLALRAEPKGQSLGDAYILAVGDTWSSGDMDLDDLVRMRDRLAGDFLWVRRDGKTYRTTDAAAIEKAEGLFVPVRALEPEFEDLRKKEERLDDRENGLDQEQESVEQDLEDLDADEEAGLPIDASSRASLESRRDAVEAQMHDLKREQRALESVERDLDAREEKLEAEAEKKLWRFVDDAIANGVLKPTR
jgi:hypothetical protein